MIEAGKRYRIKGNSDYFREKYGTSNPVIEIRGEDTELWPDGWKGSMAAACVIYGWRNGVELLPVSGRVYYGHEIGTDLGELVHETEIEPWGEEGEPLPFQGDRMDAIKNITFENSDPELNKGIEVRTMNMSRLEGQVCGFCGKPGDEEKPLKVWISTYNETRWFYHDSCLWDEMERDELQEGEEGAVDVTVFPLQGESYD